MEERLCQEAWLYNNMQIIPTLWNYKEKTTKTIRFVILLQTQGKGDSMAAIRPCSGTTADWKAVEDALILKDREIGIETTETGKVLIRMGDGKNKFFDLPIIVNNAKYDEDLEIIEGYMEKVNKFSNTMTESSNAANKAATTANAAAQTATAAATACEGIVDGLNTMVDTVTKKSCVLSVEDGILTIREA